MKCLSILQPWAWLIVHGHKAIENRKWTTSYRGDLLIHAGKGFDPEGYAWVRDEFPSIALPHTGDFQRGGIVGQAVLLDVVAFSLSPWFFGPFGWVLSGARPRPFVPLRGQLGLFTVTISLHAAPADSADPDQTSLLDVIDQDPNQ